MSAVININAWMKDLERDSRGAYKTNLATVMKVLRVSPELKGVLGFDRFSHTVTVMGKLPWDERDGMRPIEESDPILFQEWLQQNGINVKAKNTVHKLVSKGDPVIYWKDKKTGRWNSAVGSGIDKLKT